MHVYAYFEQMLGTPPTDATLKELPLTSNCGEDCRKAIFAGHQLVQHIRMAIGDATAQEIAVVQAVDITVQVYWRG